MSVQNNIHLIGRLVRDPEMRMTPVGNAVTNFTLAVDRDYVNEQGQKETDFIDIVVWRKRAEVCAQYLVKGSLVAIEGRLQIRTYENQEGQKRKVAEVVAESVKFLDKRKQTEGQTSKPSDDLDGLDIPI